MSVKRLTVFGAGGFIGRSVLGLAADYGYDAVRGDWRDLPLDENMGDIVYCLGVGDCAKPNQVLESHLIILKEIVSKGVFDRLTYVSSTRLYMGNDSSSENSELKILPKDNRKLFNLIKLSAEAYLECSGVNYRVVRLSNVFGCAINSPLFLPSIVRDAVLKKEVHMYVPADYSKDYVLVDDVARLTLQITKSSKRKTYNIASGENVSAESISVILKRNTDCSIIWHESSNSDIFPVTDISYIVNEFSFQPHKVVNLLDQMISDFKQELT